MSSAASFIRNSEIYLEKFRHLNLRHLNDEFGYGFQSMLIKLMGQAGMYISSTEVSNLVNATQGSDGSMRSVFHDAAARRIEKALDLPMSCLDLPDWYFRTNLDYFWQYASRAAEDREWFDGLLRRLLAVPAYQPVNAPANKISSHSVDWALIRERLQQKQAAPE